MKKTISTYWPVVILLPVVLAFCLHGRPGERVRHEQTSVAGVSAELARAISLGLVEDEDDGGATPAVLSKEKTL